MSQILTPNGQATQNQEEVPLGTITIAFFDGGKIGWRADGEVMPAQAVNMLEVIKASYVQRQLQAAMAAKMQQMQKSVCLPDGSVPLH